MDPASHRTVLFTPLGLNLAEVTRMIQVAQALPRTVEPVFLVHDAGFDHLVDRAGLRRVPGERPFTAREAAQVMAFDQGRTPRHPFTYEVVRRRVQREREAIRAVGAVAVVHGTNPTSTLSARAEAVPLFYPVPYAWSTPMLRGGRPLPLLADRGLGHVVNRVLTPPVRHAMTASHLLVPGSFRRVAAGAGVRLDSPMDLLGADVTLLTCTEDEVTGALPPDTHVVGPIFAHLDAEIPALVHELAASDRPLVYMAFGSSGNRPLVLSAMRAVASAPIEVVAPVRQYLRAGDEALVPHNVHVVDLLPAHRLGPLVDAAILHGGQGTVQTACATAVPFVGIGLSAEQRWNVDVCVRSGNALALTPPDVRRGTRRFQTALAHVVRDPRIRAAAHRVAEHHRTVDGAVRSAEIISRSIGDRSAV